MANKIIPSFIEHPTPWKEESKQRVFVLMSGGVDSSVAAYLLKQQGWDVAGITMELLHPRKQEGSVSPAAGICREIGIPHFFIDLKQEFYSSVVTPFRQAYEKGRTPNPCVECNAHFKFGLLWEILEQHYAPAFHVATGHYARCGIYEGYPFLERALDTKKDQSYFLCRIAPERIPRLLLPLGEYSKEQTRAIAAQAGLAVAEKKDSMEICFAGEGNYRTILDTRQRKGPILNQEGIQLGEHNGISGYTLGQRKGLGVSAPEPLYVVQILPEQNAIIVAPKEASFFHTVRAEIPNVLIPQRYTKTAPLFGKIRSQGDPAPCKITHCDEEILEVTFDTPVFAPAPGQTLALYSAEGHIVAGATLQYGLEYKKFKKEVIF